MPRLETPPFAKSFMERISDREEKKIDVKFSSKTSRQEETENSHIIEK